jgi:hypothetical protein
MRWTRKVFVNIAPKAKENPADKKYARPYILTEKGLTL